MKKKKSNINHKKRCDCPVCQNGIREERQYAAVEVHKGKFVIIDAQELAHMDEFFQNTSKEARRKQPEYPRIEPEDNAEMKLVYGVLIPQYDSGVNDWDDWDIELLKYGMYALGALEEGNLYISAYQEYKLYPDDVVYNTHIPCALLMQTSLDLSKPREFGFGSTAFVLYQNMEIFDNILNRDFVFCLGEAEERFTQEFIENWKEYIDKERLMSVAKRLF